MKRLLLVCASLLIGLTTASASELNHPKQKIKLEKKKNYRFAEPITFIERGIEFLIFPDGSFDFNTNIHDDFYDDDVYYKNNARRNTINTSQRGPNATFAFTVGSKKKRGVHISRDRFGKVRRVGNVYINYNRIGNITRVGSVFINYSRGRHATVAQVGGLKVQYNRWGEIVSTRGYVNRNNRVSHCDVIKYEDLDRDHYDYDDDYHYYKKNNKIKKLKKNKK
jgi:hypothetical protein